jgi:glycosyltransferase involved in cell wall biosynthesis
VWIFPEEARPHAWLKSIENQPGASVYILPRRRGHLPYAMELTDIAMRENAAILHTHFSRFDIAARLAKTLCAWKGKRVEVVWHSHSAFSLKPGFRRLAQDVCKLGVLGRACYLAPVCDELRIEAEHRGFAPGRIRVIPNGIDPAHARRRARSRDDLRQEWGAQAKDLVLLGLGWEPVRKGVDTMLQALAQLRSRGTQATLVLVGTDQTLGRFVDAWPFREILPAVRVIGAVECVGDLFAAADIFVSASRAEGFSYSVAEAMLNEMPVASTRIPSLAWAFGAPGVRFFEAEDSAGLARAIEQMAAQPESERRRELQSASEFVSEHYSVHAWARSVAQLYDEVLRGKADLSACAPAGLSGGAGERA